MTLVITFVLVAVISGTVLPLLVGAVSIWAVVVSAGALRGSGRGRRK